MKIKENEGFTGIDISISIIIIVITISIIATMMYNLYLSGAGIKRNVIATDYAINILETIEQANYEEVTFNNSEDEQLKLKKKLDELLKKESQINNNTYKSNVNNFDIEIIIEKYSDRFNNSEIKKQDYIKIITVNIKYNLGKDSNNSTNTETLTIRTLKTIK